MTRKSALAVLVLFLFLNSGCQMNFESLPGFDYKNFEGTNCWGIAKAVQADDSGKIVNMASQNGVPVNCFDPKFGKSLLTLAVVNNKPSAFLALLQAGADVNAKSPKDSSTPLFELCAYSDVISDSQFYLAELIKHGANVNAAVPDSLNGKRIEITCLEKLLWTSQDTAEIGFLIDHGIDLEGYPINGERALVSIAAILNHFVVLRFLLMEKKIQIPEYTIIQESYTDGEKRLSLRETINQSKAVLYDASEKQAKADVLNFLTENGY